MQIPIYPSVPYLSHKALIACARRSRYISLIPIHMQLCIHPTHLEQQVCIAGPHSELYLSPIYLNIPYPYIYQCISIYTYINLCTYVYPIYLYTVEPLNVDTLKSGHLLYTGHFVWSQCNTTCIISPLKSEHLSNRDTFFTSQRCPHFEVPLYTYVYPYILLYTYVYPYIPMYIPIYFYIPMYTPIYLCIPLYTYVYPYILIYTYAYPYILMYLCIPLYTYAYPYILI